MDSGKLARLDGVEIRRKMAGRQALHHDRRGCPVVNRIRNGHECRRRNDGPAGIAAGGVNLDYAFARLEVFDTFADGQDTARAFDAEDRLPFRTSRAGRRYS